MKKSILTYFATLVLAVVFAVPLRAQDVSLKTNIIYDAILTPNIGVEVGLAPKWSLDITGQLNNWTVDGHRWKQAVAQPEARYWLCRRFAGHFFGAHALGGVYNYGNFNFPVSFLGTDYRQFKDYRHQGWLVGAGLAYGYAWILDKHWNLEAEIGLGWVYTHYDVYRCANCGKKLKSGQHHNYYGVTKAAINFVYLF